MKGIEPSYSAWKAAALPLSYTRIAAINYHAMQAASTALPALYWLQQFLFLRCLQPSVPLTAPDSAPILGAPPTMKGGDPVSYTKRCHLAGIAR